MSVVLTHQQVEAVQAAVAVVSVRYQGKITKVEVAEPTIDGVVTVNAIAETFDPQGRAPYHVEILVNLVEGVADFHEERFWLLRGTHYSVPVITVSSHEPFKVPANVDLSSL